MRDTEIIKIINDKITSSKSSIDRNIIWSSDFLGFQRELKENLRAIKILLRKLQNPAALQEFLLQLSYLEQHLVPVDKIVSSGLQHFEKLHDKLTKEIATLDLEHQRYLASSDFYNSFIRFYNAIYHTPTTTDHERAKLDIMNQQYKTLLQTIQKCNKVACIVESQIEAASIGLKTWL